VSEEPSSRVTESGIPLHRDLILTRIFLHFRDIGHLCSKFKVSRGGGRHFSRDISVVDHGMETLGLEDEGSDSNEESSEEESESSDDGLGGGGGGASSARAEPEMTRAERKALKKAQSGKKKGQPGPGDLPGSSEDESEDEPLPDRNNMGPSRKEK
jgi:hypothetical protein